MKNEYDIIYADPPWSYQDKSMNRGGAERHYSTMNLKDICQLNIPAKENSVLFMWATYPLLPEALNVIEAWGFQYKTCAFTWVKTNKISHDSLYMGMGHYTRSNAEICLLATRGKPLLRYSKSIRNTHLFPVRRHSAKPSEFRDMIVQLYGDQTSKLEMFAREKAEGWDSWGNEIV
jgi:site-specific DNA-methyltransferase (adenine-specific)